MEQTFLLWGTYLALQVCPMASCSTKCYVDSCFTFCYTILYRVIGIIYQKYFFRPSIGNMWRSLVS